MKKAERVYKLSRIKNLLVTDEAFKQREVFKLENEFTADSLEVEEYVTLKFRIEPEKAYRVYDDFDEADVKKQADGSFFVTTAFPMDSLWIYGFVLSYGKHIEVLAPEALREMIKDEASEILQKYL